MDAKPLGWTPSARFKWDTISIDWRNRESPLKNPPTTSTMWLFTEKNKIKYTKNNTPLSVNSLCWLFYFSAQNTTKFHSTTSTKQAKLCSSQRHETATLKLFLQPGLQPPIQPRRKPHFFSRSVPVSSKSILWTGRGIKVGHPVLQKVFFYFCTFFQSKNDLCHLD